MDRSNSTKRFIHCLNNDTDVGRYSPHGPSTWPNFVAPQLFLATEEARQLNEDLSKPTHTVTPRRMSKPLSPKNQCSLVRDVPKLLDDGGDIPKSQGRSCRFDS